MKKNLDQWERIFDLIALDRKTALDEFHRHEFVPGRLPERQVPPPPAKKNPENKNPE
jgi:hypothetical protein